jgi:hypothetical protein
MSWRLLHKTQVLNSLKKGISQHKLEFIINHSNLTKRCWGELTKALGWEFSLDEPTTSKGGRGKTFIFVPQKTSHWKLASKNRNIQFWNRNIRLLKYSHYMPNWTLRFGNRNIRFSQSLWEVESMRSLSFTHPTWIFRLCWVLRLYWQSMWYPSWQSDIYTHD